LSDDWKRLNKAAVDTLLSETVKISLYEIRLFREHDEAANKNAN